MPDVNNFDFWDTTVYDAQVGAFDVNNIDFIPTDIYDAGVGAFDVNNIDFQGPLAVIVRDFSAFMLVEEPDDREEMGLPTFSSSTAASTPPVISNVTPAQATAIASNAVLGFDVTDPDGFRLVMLIADFPNIGIREVIHDGQSFSQNYSGFGNSRVAIADGFRYTILRLGGWPVSPRVIPYAIDVTGAENI